MWAMTFLALLPPVPFLTGLDLFAMGDLTSSSVVVSIFCYVAWGSVTMLLVLVPPKGLLVVPDPSILLSSLTLFVWFNMLLDENF
jgi:hypothetical protein